MWVDFLLVAINLGQICALIAGRGIYEREPLQLIIPMRAFLVIQLDQRMKQSWLDWIENE